MFFIFLVFQTAHADVAGEVSSPVTTKARYWLIGGAAITGTLLIFEDQIVDPTQKEAVEDKPLANWSKLGDYPRALADYTESIRYEQRQRMPGGNGINRDGQQYVWRGELYAACPDPQIRNAQKAIADAKRAGGVMISQKHEAQAVLAAAYAEAGDFPEALEWQRKAIVVAEQERADSDPDWLKEEAAKRLDEYRRRLALFESHQPYRLPAVIKVGSAPVK